jgi:Cupredoxin-like domain
VPAVHAGKLPLAIASLALVVALGGCSHTRQAGAGRTVQMSVNEFRLNPQSVDASAGVLAIVVHNYGRLTHNLVVSANGQSVAGTKPIPPGQTTELDLNLAPGTYQMASTMLSDEALGAYGTLTVK